MLHKCTRKGKQTFSQLLQHGLGQFNFLSSLYIRYKKLDEHELNSQSIPFQNTKSHTCMQYITQWAKYGRIVQKIIYFAKYEYESRL